MLKKCKNMVKPANLSQWRSKVNQQVMYIKTLGISGRFISRIQIGLK
ncbi:Bgt-51448 [Blumeria graminis f. sp. tritici]|uniref:Bgt-51448 n=1 Tax=Blumeria graminis f. sp. tritici TaxID=62690 RepID=A0A9X9L9R6_BLUGR|nr:Bgt-51448 [Blumeria graminis f. sp. tritici]